MSIIKVNAIQHTSANDTNMTFFANGNIAMTTANSVLRVGNTAIGNNSISVGGLGISQYSGMMKNRIINGDMRIDQRFAGGANNNVTGAQYVVDRWWYAYGGFPSNRFRFQQNNTNGPGQTATQTATGFSYYYGANVVTSNTTVNASDYLVLAQTIEALNMTDLGWGTSNASPATLSFWVYSSVPGTYGGSLRNGNADRSYPFSYNISSANTWQYQSITIPGDTTGSWWSNNNVGITLTLNIGGVGSTYSSTANGTWQSGNYFNATGAVNVVTAANGAYYLTGVQLEKGSQATAFEFRHYTTELQLCQRYYSQGYNGVQGQAYSATNATVTFFFPVEMRATPVIGYTGGATSTSVDYIGGTQSGVTIAASGGGQNSRNWSATLSNMSGRTTWQAVILNGNNISFSAELGVQN